MLACLNKVPKLRPSYQALLGSDWLQTLTKPETITEDEEEEHPGEPIATVLCSLTPGVVRVELGGGGRG